MKFKKLLTYLTITLLNIGVVPSASSEPTSGPITIVNIRPYGGSNVVYLNGSNPPGSFCSSSWYSIDISSNGGKAIFSVALTALATGKSVQLEIAGCGAGPAGSNLLQSIYILN